MDMVKDALDREDLEYSIKEYKDTAYDGLFCPPERLRQPLCEGKRRSSGESNCEAHYDPCPMLHFQRINPVDSIFDLKYITFVGAGERQAS